MAPTTQTFARPQSPMRAPQDPSICPFHSFSGPPIWADLPVGAAWVKVTQNPLHVPLSKRTKQDKRVCLQLAEGLPLAKLNFIDHSSYGRPKKRQAFIEEGLSLARDLRLEVGATTLTRQQEIALFKGLNSALKEVSVRRRHLAKCNGNLYQELKGIQLALLCHHECRSCLVERNMGLVYSMKLKFKNTIQPALDDFNSEGLEALLQAVDGFDFSRGNRFSTYACTSIIRRFLLVQKRALRIQSRGLSSEGKNLDRLPSTQETSFEHCVASDEAARGRSLLLSKLSELPMLQRYVLYLRSVGLNGKPLTLAEIAKMFRVSWQWISKQNNLGLATFIGADNPTTESHTTENEVTS